MIAGGRRSRLTGITYPDRSTVSFTYDSRGRRITSTDQNGKTTTYTYDDADRLTAVTDPASNTTQYAYDTRFKKRQSGNPKGRPKGSTSFASSASRVLQERVNINEGGRRKTVTKLVAALKQIANKAASGDATTLRLLITIVQLMEQRSSDLPTSLERLDEGDEKLVMGLLARLKLDENGGSSK